MGSPFADAVGDGEPEEKSAMTVKSTIPPMNASPVPSANPANLENLANLANPVDRPAEALSWRTRLSRLLTGGRTPLWGQPLLLLDGLAGLGLYGALLAMEAFRVAPQSGGFFRTPGRPPRVLFLTNERLSLPSARARCVEPAALLRGEGFTTSVLSLSDAYFPGLGGTFTRLSDAEKVWANLRAFADLAADPPEILVLQRVYYHALAPLLLARRSQVRLIVDFDDLDWRDNPNRFKFLSRLPPFDYRVLAPRLIRMAAACTVVSTELGREVGLFNPRTSLLPIAIDLDRFPALPLRRADEVVFSWRGTLMRRENLETLEELIAIFKALSSRVPRRLVIHGVGTWFEDLRARAAGIPGVEIHPWVPPEKLAESLAATDVGLVPQFVDSPFVRGKAPIKLLEYLASGRPVIASAVGEAATMLRDGIDGLLAHTPAAFAAAMQRLLEDAGLRERLAQEGRQTVEQRFNQRRNAAALAALCREVLGESR